jgi:hypothetical protein
LVSKEKKPNYLQLHGGNTMTQEIRISKVGIKSKKYNPTVVKKEEHTRNMKVFGRRKITPPKRT